MRKIFGFMIVAAFLISCEAPSENTDNEGITRPSFEQGTPPEEDINTETPGDTSALDSVSTNDEDVIDLETEEDTNPNQNEDNIIGFISDGDGNIVSTATSASIDEEKPLRLHLGFDALLKKHVSPDGTVNYKELKKDRAKLDAYCKLLKEHPVQKAWTKDRKLVYWINAYNAFTLKLIVDNYPVKSITDLHGGKPWDVKWIQLGLKKYSLDQIENEIIRPRFKEPRIHFAVNCAAKSCPKLMNGAFLENELEVQLERQTRAFINNKSVNTISSSGGNVSKIFEWYAADFGDLKAYLNKYSATKLSSSASITYKEYNWQLNE